MSVSTFTRSSFPMAPGRLPLVGHLPRIHTDVLGLVRRAARTVGPVFRLDHGFGDHPTYLYGDEAFALLRNEKVDSSANHHFAPLVVRHSLIPEDGATHRRMRGAIDGPFSPKSLDAAKVGAIVHDVVSARLAGWDGERTLTIANETREITLDVIFRIMGIEGAALAEWRTQFHEFTLGLVNLPFEFPGSPRWRAKRAIQWLDERITALVAERRRRNDRQTFLGAIVHGEDEHGHRLDDAELLGNLRLLGLAGHETTASAMTWMVLRLAADPGLWARLCEEALAADGPPLGPAELAHFPLAEALFRETVRFYPPTWFVFRRAKAGLELCGVPVPEGTLIVLPIIALSRSEQRYADPDAFEPARWLDHDRARSPIETCQFGGGPHFCLGYRLALLEGIQFVVSVARTLGSRGLRPALTGPLPTPRFLPLTHAPFGTKVRFERARTFFARRGAQPASTGT